MKLFQKLIYLMKELLFQHGKVNIAGIITAINNNTSTTINGDKIKSGSITSNNYVEGSKGTKIDLNNGTIDSQNFKLDEYGNVNLKSGAKVIGGDGLLTNFQYLSNGKYQTYDWLGFNAESNGSYLSYYKQDVSVEVDIPKNFIVTQAKLTLYHTPINWSYTDSNYNIQTVDGYSRNLKLYKVISDDSNFNFNMMRFSEGKIDGSYLSLSEISKAFGSTTYTPTNKSGNTIEKKESIDITNYVKGEGKHKLVVRTNDAVPSDELTACSKTGMARIVVDVIGYIRY